MEKIMPEATQMGKFKHENITKYHEYFLNEKKTFLYIVYEYCEVRVLFNLL
jgi:serine/threonine protein kinase